MHKGFKGHYSKKTFIVNGVKFQLNKEKRNNKLYGCPRGES